MENGSRALLMAATVLLGIFLLSIMIYMFRAGGRVSKAYDDKQINQQLEAHNGQFEYYDTPYNTITDVVSLANLVYSTNEECEYTNGYAIQLEIDIAGAIYSIPSEYKNENATKLSEKQYLTQRNTIAFGADKKEVSIFNLMNTPVNQLKQLNGTASSFTLTKYNTESNSTVNITDTLSETLSQTRLDGNNRRIYKYIFVCESGDDFEYYDETGRVKSIKLKLYINPEY
ncbi:MAG: hypothetical protein IJW20_04170 [Clostridia bacterium]|nr:hypothetical protein [Clostridia bacterium]